MSAELAIISTPLTPYRWNSVAPNAIAAVTNSSTCATHTCERVLMFHDSSAAAINPRLTSVRIDMRPGCGMAGESRASS